MSPIVGIIGSLVSIVAGWYLQKLARGWFQRYKNKKDTIANAGASESASGAQQAAESEQDKLRKREEDHLRQS